MDIEIEDETMIRALELLIHDKRYEALFEILRVLRESHRKILDIRDGYEDEIDFPTFEAISLFAQTVWKTVDDCKDIQRKILRHYYEKVKKGEV